MAQTTKIEKGYDGWRARTEIDLEDSRVLVINTSKAFRCLRAQATVHARDKFGYLVFVMFGDFTKRILTDTTSRCTEKTIRALHEQALGAVPFIKVAVAAHYDAQPEMVPA